MSQILEPPADAVDDIDLRIGSTTDLLAEANAIYITTFTATLSDSCTCPTCSEGNCTTIMRC
ncbi:MAG: hypothetical protein QOD51_2639 [Candidatus Eremiobacteraeota bacterium]|nr:hypothetical protein [Candidatus Eremiobacteraeota bacterium]